MRVRVTSSFVLSTGGKLVTINVGDVLDVDPRDPRIAAGQLARIPEQPETATRAAPEAAVTRRKEGRRR